MFAEALEGRRLLAAVPVSLGDINQTTDFFAPGPITQVGRVGFFAARPSETDGAELFKTDGTKAGTVLVKDINPAVGSAPTHLTRSGNLLYFVANDGVHGDELWCSDGTAAGTRMVSDLFTGSLGSAPQQLTDVDGTLYFVATSRTGQALMRTDGTTAGTVAITDVANGNPFPSVTGIAPLNGGVVFGASHTYDFEAIYTLPAGPGTSATRLAGGPTSVENVIAFNGAAYFTMNSGTDYYHVEGGPTAGDLWRTDGTAAGTTLVKAIDIIADGNHANDRTSVTSIVVSGDRLYFVASNYGNGAPRLYTSDGTGPGTVQVASPQSADAAVTLVPIGTRSVLFAQNSQASATFQVLWASDGTTAGTVKLTDAALAEANQRTLQFSAAPLPGGRVAFVTLDAAGVARQVWSTNGTVAGTSLVTTIDAADGGAGVAALGSVNGIALFDGHVGVYGGDLYRSDGTAAGTTRLGANVPTNASGLDAAQQAPLFLRQGNTLYFTASDGSTGRELWKIVGRGAAVRVADLLAGGIGSDPTNLVAADDGSVYFAASTTSHGNSAIYRIAANGTGPTLVVPPGAAKAATYAGLATIGNTLYFVASGGGIEYSRPQLWRYFAVAGTASAVIWSGGTLSPGALMRAGAYLYFGGSAVYSDALFRVGVDAAAPAELVATIAGGYGYVPVPLAAVGSTIYFVATTSANGAELWKSDGTAAGTAIVVDLTAGGGSSTFANSTPQHAVALGTTLYFAGGTGNPVVYRTDGTAAGTRAIATPGVTAVWSPSFLVSGGQVYFTATGTNGTAVYRIDGDQATAVTTPAAAETEAFRPASLIAAGDAVFLVGSAGATNTTARVELWRAGASLGTPERVAVLAPLSTNEINGAGFKYFFTAGGAFAATDADLVFPMYAPSNGIEPYRLALRPEGSIRGSIYDDANANAVRDDNEVAAAGVSVYADVDGNNAFDAGEPTALSTASGYTIEGVAPGTYNVRLLQPTDGRRPVIAIASGVSVAADQTAVAADLSVTGRLGIFGDSVLNEGGPGATLSAEVYGVVPTGLIYEWDFDDRDGTGGTDATGASVTFPAAKLDGPTTRTVTLRLRDASNAWTQSARQIQTIVNVAPTATLTAGSAVAFGTATTVRFGNVVDPSAADVAAGFKYSFDFNNDGDFADAGDVLNSSSAYASFTFAAAGTYAVRGRIMDKDGGFTDYTTSAVVTAAATPPAPTRVGFTQTDTAVEGGKGGTLEGHADVVSGQSIVRWEYDYAYDGVTFAADSAGDSPTGFLSVDDGPVTVTVAIRVTDNYGQSVIAAQAVRVYNTGPHATFGATSSGNVATATFTNVSDASAADRAAGFVYSFDFNNNGVYTDAGDVRLSASPTASFAYAAAGTYTIRGIVADKDGAYVEFTARATVTAPPTVKPPPPANVGWDTLAIPTEGATIGLIGTALPLASGQSIVTWAWDYDYDGARFDVDATGKQPSITLPDGRSTRQVALRVTDNFGQVVTKAQTLTIANVAPTATFNATGGAGSATATFANVVDPSAADRNAGFKYSFDFNNDGDFTDPGEVDRGTSPAATGTYAAAGTYTVLGRIYDKDGDYSKYVAAVTVAAPPPPAPTQQPPVPNIANGLIYEGQKTLFYGDATLAASRTAAKWEWDFDYVGTTFTVDATTQQALFDATNVDGPSTRRVALRVTDSAGQAGLAVKTVSVLNVIPSAGFTVVVNADGSVTATFVNPTDVGAADRAAGFTYSFDFSGGYDDYLDPGDIVRSTSPTATHKYAASGTFLIGARLYDKDGDYGSYGGQRVTVTVPTTPPPTTTPVQLAGTPIGTAGSIGGNTIAKAFDGQLATYVDLPTQTGAWIGLDLGSAKAIASVKFAPRAGLARRMTGGVFQASNSATFATGVVTLGTIASQPAEGVLTTLAFAASSATYRYVRYLAPAGSFGNVAELQFLGTAGGTTPPPPVVTPPPPPAGTLTKLTGTGIGTAGSIGGNGFAKALDGDLSTYVDSSTVSGAFVGLDLGTARVIKQIKFAPRATLGRRMVGGYFQGSNVADFSVATTLFTIAAAPIDGVLTSVDLTNATAYRYVRYVAPANSFGNVAEVQFYG